MNFKSFSNLFINKNFVHCDSTIIRRQYATILSNPIEGKYAVKDLGINVLRTGTGHDVFCLPGSLGTIWTDFGPQIEGFNLSKYSLNVWDPPGYGNSRPPERTFVPKFYERDAYYAALLIKKLKIVPCCVLGWSDGGITAMILAAKYPQLVNKLVIWGANAYITEKDLNIYKSIRDISKWSPQMRQPLVDIYGEKRLQYLMNCWVEAMILIKDCNEGEICTDMVTWIKAPTLILHGEKDPLVPRYHVDFLFQRIENASLHLMPEGKHNIHIKYAREFNEVVQKFLYGL